MSWGRFPYYIFSDGTNVWFYGPGVETSVPEDAIAQLVTSMANLGTDEITEFVERGKKLRPDILPSLKVTVEGNGWKRKEVKK